MLSLNTLIVKQVLWPENGPQSGAPPNIGYSLTSQEGNAAKFSLCSTHSPYFLNLSVPTEVLSRNFCVMLKMTSVTIFKLRHGCQGFLE